MLRTSKDGQKGNSKNFEQNIPKIRTHAAIDMHHFKKWWQDPELNLGHKDFQFSS
jgi:hypothetical protein